MEYIGIQTQKSRNDFRSMLLLFMFPCLVIGLVYLFCVVMVKLGVAGNMETEGNLWSISGSVFLEAAPYAIGGIALWFVIAYFLNTLIIKASTGAIILPSPCETGTGSRCVLRQVGTKIVFFPH